MDFRVRTAGSLVAIIIMLSIMYPRQFWISSVILIVAGLIFQFVIKPKSAQQKDLADKAVRRRIALDVAKIYLSPYDSIWKNLKLSNKHCILKLGYDGKTIICKDKTSDKRFRVVNSKVHSITDLWDMFCLNYSHATTYDGLVDECRLFQAEIIQKGVSVPVSTSRSVKKASSLKPENNEIVDVNNASEIELTELPGISIVLAKRIIKKREEIGGFKNINEFFVYVKLKQHMETRLRKLVTVSKMRGSLKIERFKERKVDL